MKNVSPNRSLRGILVVIIIGLISQSLLFGQSPVVLDLNSVPHTLEPVATAPEQIRLKFNLGTPQTPVNNVLSYELRIQFPNLAVSPRSLSVELDKSCVGTLGEGELNYWFDPINAELQIDYSLHNGVPANADGPLLEIKLETDAALTSTQKLAVAGGGAIMVENMEFKRLPGWSEDSPLFNAYPCPFKDRLNLKGFSGETGTVTLTDLKGRQFFLAKGEVPESLDTSLLPSGIYVLMIRTDTGKMVTKKVVRAQK